MTYTEKELCSSETIVMKNTITEEDYKELCSLEMLCKEENINLKLELPYKLSLLASKTGALPSPSCMKEYFYYSGNALVSYLGICSFGGNVYEVNGLTHPDYRKRGLFKRLYQHAAKECRSFEKNKLLLITDANSTSGIGFIESVGGAYAFTESRMTLSSADYSNYHFEKEDIREKVLLREATAKDAALIQKYDRVLYADEEEEETDTLAERNLTSVQNTCLIEGKGTILGKIRIDMQKEEAFLYGFGILPEFRGQGYGKAALGEALRIIFEKGCKTAALDVETKNDRAFSIYTGNGFHPVSAMKYYEVCLSSDLI